MMGKVIIITGVSSGIGKACAKYLTLKGHVVYGTMRHLVNSALSYPVLQMDVTDKASIQQAVQDVLGKEGRIDVLINNAGMGIGGSIEDYTDDEINDQFNTNFFGTLNMCRAVIPSMRKNKNGLIINISSLGGLMGLPFQGIYSASKFAVEGMSRSLKMELKASGLKVVLINPGDFHTKFTDNRSVSSNIEISPNREQYLKTIKVIEYDERNGSDPITIAKKILKIISKKSPKTNYMIGNIEQIIFTRSKGILPSKWFEAVLGSHYKIK
jgi:NAD(P)-dependent dehydrogenase (short-subunit alcohol dehydrogenase family)